VEEKKTSHPDEVLWKILSSLAKIYTSLRYVSKFFNAHSLEFSYALHGVRKIRKFSLIIDNYKTIMELLTNLGINGKLLLAQIVNFLVLLFVLKKFAYGPVLKLLEKRTKKIEKGLKDAEEAQKKLVEITEKEKEVLAKARKQAQEIVANAEKVALKNKEEIVVAAKQQSEKILVDAEKKIELEKNKMLLEVKTEIGGLVAVATEKIIGEKMDSQKDKELIERAIK